VRRFQGHLLGSKTKKREKNIFKSHLKENIQMEKGTVSKEPQMQGDLAVPSAELWLQTLWALLISTYTN